MTREAKDTYGERPHSVASKRGLKRQHPVPLSVPPLGQATDGNNRAHVELSPQAHPIPKLHWPRDIGPPHPTQKSLAWACC